MLGAPEAGGVIRRCLHSDDAEIRAQAIEALDSIGDRRLARRSSRLLEDEAIDVRDRAMPRLPGCADDDDPWISGLARRVRAGGTGCRTRVGPSAISTRCCCCAASRCSRPRAGGPPADRDDSVEHVYPDDEALVREGDLGDELVVIVEGSVRVVRAEPTAPSA